MARRKQNKKLSELLLSKQKELAEGIVSEELSAVYLDLSVLKHQPEPIYRLDLNNYRYYYRFVDNEPVFYTSVTTMIKNTLPTPRALIKWMTEQDDGEAEVLERASYGTFMHKICQMLLISGFYDIDKLPKELKEFCEKEKIPYKQEWEKELKKDVLAFAQLIIDKQIRPLAVEIILYHPTDGYAGALDLVCEMLFNKKRINVIIDLKSGRKGFYESHEIQLMAYKEMWQQHFPDIEIHKLMNFSPKNWQSTPTYNLKDQTEAKSMAKLPHLVALANIEEDRRDKSVMVISGKIEPAKGLSRNINEMSLKDLIKGNNDSKTEI